MESISEEEYKKLNDSNKTIKPFSLKGLMKYGKVIDVYDGDTCKVNLLLKDTITQFTIRMMGYDCPEMKTKNTNEKHFAMRSKQIMSHLVFEKMVKVECLDFDKYGRLLANLYCIREDTNEELNVNQYMIDNHLGHPYLGDTKTTFDTLFSQGYYKEEQSGGGSYPKTISYPLGGIIVPKKTKKWYSFSLRRKN